MNHQAKSTELVSQGSSDLRPKSERAIWGTLLIIWFAVLCFVPDARPLAAPAWSVRIVRSITTLGEPAARAVATIALRSFGIGVLGVLISMYLSSVRMRRAAPIALLAAPLLAVASLWVNYRYFPVAFQIQLGVASALIGALCGLSFRRSLWPKIALILSAGAIFVWGASTTVSDELDLAARAIGTKLIAKADSIPEGDNGFAAMVHAAFEMAADHSEETDAVLANKAAILALGVILGDEKVAKAAKRSVEFDDIEVVRSLRNRVTLRGRHDLPRHFWVSAALAVISDEQRSITVGIGKEMMDATPGGSGFSFVDLTADQAGIMFAAVATKNADAARKTKLRVRKLSSSDFLPDIEGLPEGLTGDQFQKEFGGLGGAKTKLMVREIQRRLSTCRALADES